jgi:hypothetical protein
VFGDLLSLLLERTQKRNKKKRSGSWRKSA